MCLRLISTAHQCNRAADSVRVTTCCRIVCCKVKITRDCLTSRRRYRLLVALEIFFTKSVKRPGCEPLTGGSTNPFHNVQCSNGSRRTHGGISPTKGTDRGDGGARVGVRVLLLDLSLSTTSFSICSCPGSSVRHDGTFSCDRERRAD